LQDAVVSLASHLCKRRLNTVQSLPSNSEKRSQSFFFFVSFDGDDLHHHQPQLRMTRFVADGIGSRDGKGGRVNRRKELEQFQRTGRHPELEAAAASRAAAAASAPLPARDAERKHVFLDLSLPSPPSLVRLIIEVFDDVDRAAGGALLSLFDGGGQGGLAPVVGARLSRASLQGLFFTSGAGGTTTALSPSSSSSSSTSPILHHTEPGVVSISRELLSGGGTGRAPIAVLFKPCGPLDASFAVAGRVVLSSSASSARACLPTLERLEAMAQSDVEETARGHARRVLLTPSSVEVVAAGRATRKQALCLETAAELDAEAERGARERAEAARAAASPAAAAARAEAEAAAARGAVEEALAASIAAAEEEEGGGDKKKKKRDDDSDGDDEKKRKKKKKKKKRGGMLDDVLGGGDGGDADDDEESSESE